MAKAAAGRREIRFGLCDDPSRAWPRFGRKNISNDPPIVDGDEMGINGGEILHFRRRPTRAARS